MPISVEMPTIPVRMRVDGKRILEDLQHAIKKLDLAASDMELDFSAVHRVDTGVIRELDALADSADKKSVKLSLFGVNVEVYKVLKLVKLSRRFSLVN